MFAPRSTLSTALARCSVSARNQIRCALVALIALAACTASDDLTGIRKQQASGHYSATIEPLRELLERDKENGEVNFLYGLALVRTGQRGLAEWSLRKAMDDPEWRLPAGRQLAFGEMVAGNHGPAIETLTTLIDEHPDDVELLMMRANANAHSRIHLEEALADADRVFALDPENVDAMEPRILALLGLDRIDEAREAIEDLGERIDTNQPDGDLPGWHCATAALFAFESNELELAAERWADCSERFPGHRNVVLNAISYHDARREFGRSLEILERAVEADPSSREFRVQYATRLRVAGKLEEAAAVLRTATEAPEPAVAATAWFDLAKHYQTVTDDENAVAAFEESMELAEKTGSAMGQMKLEYADALVLAGNLDRALEVADTMSVAAHRAVIRARVAQERGDARKALEYFEESFRLWPDNPWTRYFAAVAAESIGDFDRAVESYRYSVRIASGATNARQRLARLHLSEGKPGEAIHILRLKAEHDPLGLEGELLTFEIWGALGDLGSIRIQLARISQAEIRGQALAAAARGLRERSGAAAAVQLIRQSEAVDLTSPDFADALGELVRSHAAVGSGGAAEDVRAALAAHPEVPALLAIEGLWAELAGDAESARGSYQRALAKDPESVTARTGLCRLAPAAEPEAVVSACQPALALSPGDRDSALASSRALRALGRDADAVRVLESALAQRPYEPELASELATSLSSLPDADAERIESLQARAKRFARGARAPGTGGSVKSGASS